jgi:hypothetical protein
MPLSSTATLSCAIFAVACYSKKPGANNCRMETAAGHQN